MKLTEKAISKVTERPVALALALALNFSEQWIVKVIAANKNNGPMTTAKALELIRKETGLPDSEILEESIKEASQ